MREAKNGHFASSFKLPSASSTAPRGGGVNVERVCHSCGSFFYRVGHVSHNNQAGPPCWELHGPLPPGKDSAVTEERQKTKPGPFSSSAGSLEKHQGACCVE